MSISINPSNTNLMQASKFLLSFTRLPYVTYFCTKCNLPGLSAGQAVQQNPFIDAPVPGDKMVYDPLEIEFLIDEPLWSWTTISDWIKGYTFPEDFDQYKNLSLQQQLILRNQTTTPQYSDAMLTVLTNKNNPVVVAQFKDVFPISLSSINFDTSISAQTVITAKASFKFTNFDISRPSV
jgi:hypothetical protein